MKTNLDYNNYNSYVIQIIEDFILQLLEDIIVNKNKLKFKYSLN